MKSTSFVFYDLETSGLRARQDRIMQFAAQRTNLDLEPVGEPYNFLIKLSDDVLPSPMAIKVTGITPQKTLAEGYSEAEAAKILLKEVFTPGSIAVGYNNVRFDDEFIRHLLWRNFYDAYEWSYKDGRSRWDLLDVVRLFRALRPGQINWPVADDGQATNRLELISAANQLAHAQAHDALSDVTALIAVGQMLRQSDQGLWDELLARRDKNLVHQLVNLDYPEAFIYASGKLESEFNKTTLAYPLVCSKNNNIIVFNLRYDPTELIGKSPAKLVDFLATKLNPSIVKLNSPKTGAGEKNGDIISNRPIYFKEFKYNQCPAVAPISFLQTEDWRRLQLDSETVARRVAVLRAHPELGQTIKRLYDLKQAQIETKYATQDLPVEACLYDGFLPDSDRRLAGEIVAATSNQLAKLQPKFSDRRLPTLFINYKARSFSNLLTASEAQAWESDRAKRLTAQLPAFLAELEALALEAGDANHYCVEELKLWLESLWPGDI